LSLTAPARADLEYKASGEDIYRIDRTGTFSKVSYDGTERLSVQRLGRIWRFQAQARYTRDGPDGKSRGQALFVQVLLPNGTFEDRVDADPDFLTILNQPFAVHLDAATLRDLRDLRGRVPFSAASPLGAASVVQGFLRPGVSGPIGGRPTAAVQFEADGNLNGPLPGYSNGLLAGTIHMDGTAYYALDGAVLLALSVRLTLDARLSQNKPSVSVPVRITYLRLIRAQPPSKTPRQAPLATGAGTGSLATP